MVCSDSTHRSELTKSELAIVGVGLFEGAQAAIEE